MSFPRHAYRQAGNWESSAKIIVFFSAAILFLANVLPALAIDDVFAPTNQADIDAICDLSKLPTEKSAFLPDCVYFEGTLFEKDCGCRNVNIFVDFLVKYANGMFFFVGGGALLFFVYGGFVILTAAGGERVKKGKDIIVAAVIGLIIIFTAQVGLKFVLKALLTPAIGEKTTGAPATLEGLKIKVIEPK
ncbi:MAG TPA: hypothetical protein DEB73_01290 [Candidatus Magasanikbacteria bacterium]|nr:MAG: hypothetical protein UU49_C0040G0002 [Candidatus Magasanikbacteria bacterium GW2011_GWC2_41_17]HBV57885.1 hypothetical protein [Candidatus Magasanikbacteria bacterium]